ncbi:MAG: NAD(P)H-dependent oxidoreductase [Novosphingobium sp.]
MARAAARGAGDMAMILRAADTRAEHLLAASAYLFVCPENLGSMSGEMKEMFDRCYYPLLGRIEGRGYATMIAAGSAGQGAEAQIERIVTGWRLRRIAERMIVNLQADTPQTILTAKSPSRAVLKQCREMGMAIGVGMRMGVF